MHCRQGPPWTWKYVPAVPLMVEIFVEKENIAVRKGFTNNLQSFCVPKKIFDDMNNHVYIWIVLIFTWNHDLTGIHIMMPWMTPYTCINIKE